jgi:transglutaminase-like putative cysteine protease
MAAVRRGRTLRPAIPTLKPSLAVAVSVVVALGGLNQLLVGGVWWLLAGLVAVLVVAAIGTVRYATRRPLVPTIAGAVALLVVLTLFFAADTALLGLVPTPGTVGRFGELLASGGASIQEQGVPATAVPGILFILALGAGVVAISIDAFTVVASSPALAGIPLLAIVAAPGFIDPDYTDPFYFVLAGAAWLLIVYVSSPRSQPGVAFGIGAVAMVAALVVPLALPTVEPVDSPAVGEGYATGLNPIIDLGDDLRRPSPVTALTYTTTSDARQYLRMATLGDFTDAAWEPTVGTGDDSTRPDQIAPAPGRADDIAVVESTTTVSMGNVRGRWLPVPYAPTSVTGLVGRWVWDPETLNVRSERSTVRGQDYTVTTQAADPTSDQLRAADPVVTAPLQRYLELPESLPPIVAQTAASVTASAPTNYDKAIALQSYFRGGEFTYSEDAPVENGYDGTAPTVIGQFLEVKSGYCVHFASAMAAMARTLGIPARVAVGFTAGSGADNVTTGEEVYTVTTDELHAWPELYFANVGWTRFEPTVGRTNVPEYLDAVVDDPATPDIDESVATPAPTSAPDDVAPERDDSGGVPDGQQQAGPNWNAIILGLAALAVLAMCAIPAVARIATRRRRVSQLRHGSALGAWEEVQDTAVDLGWQLSDSETPREFAERLAVDRDAREFVATGPIGGAPITAPEAVAALHRLRSAVELESFARAGGGRTPSAGEAATPSVSADDLHTVIMALRSGVDRRVRLRAALLPASVLARWFAVGSRWRGQG